MKWYRLALRQERQKASASICEDMSSPRKPASHPLREALKPANSTRHSCRVEFLVTHSKHAIGAISTRHNCTGFVRANFAPASLQNLGPSPLPCFSKRRPARFAGLPRGVSRSRQTICRETLSKTPSRERGV